MKKYDEQTLVTLLKIIKIHFTQSPWIGVNCGRNIIITTGKRGLDFSKIK